ncbi:MAG TPA: bifunctional methylenetetrahydrofolate dehydrogenase/methenyltetrahydrofolate cyclohydrolase FolD [Steroidobacteraceae bacterium]|jgi:methylenetetrahydrofolate dehydrogenase (NADP+)/methenyltetrahydrofolate cyclohydrolase|nr:bifunctional methylenetetrahydrofolate dehydrogenase/methenyltetrahydrofolate cyclohydrolase FolD [Steroidobacteraceae bacterium]
MTATIIDGKAVAANLRREIAQQVAQLSKSHGFKPGLAVVLVGNDPASEVYVGSKARSTVEAGMRSFEHRLGDQTSQAELLALIARLNADDDVDGILVQLPLPKHIDSTAVLEAVDPAKDVDGFHPVNVGRVATGAGGIVPCTPLGSLMLIKSLNTPLVGLEALIVGRSNIVGKPMVQLLLGEQCTVTIAHSKTRDLPGRCRQAEILVAAIGRPQMIRGDWVKPGAIVIDVGINRLPADAGGKSRLVGDVAFEEARQVAGAITPVPGGVGPMTIACLLKNTLQAARARRVPKA